MPDLLEDIAGNDTAVLSGWAAQFTETAPRLDALPQDKRARELLTLAREFTRRAAWAADTANGWQTEMMARLRIGMSGDKYRALFQSGLDLCRTCQSVAEIAGDLWRLAEVAGASAEEVGTAGRALEAARHRITEVENTIIPLAKQARRRTPEEIEAFFQRADAQIRSGPMLTRGQALAAIRKAK